MKQFGYLAALVVLVGGVAAYALTEQRSDAKATTASSAEKMPIPAGTGFDFYVLALSWSPTYCQDSRARSRDDVQCSGPRPFAFVVHGLWPQFERGYPKACQTRFTRPSTSQANAMLDIMPSSRLVQHEWEQHGACAGLSANDYLEVTRAAFSAVAIPQEFQSAPDWRASSAGNIEAAFLRANPQFSALGIAVSRRGNLLSEVRLCLTRDLKPRNCAEIDQSGAGPQTKLSLPPSRDTPSRR